MLRIPRKLGKAVAAAAPRGGIYSRGIGPGCVPTYVCMLPRRKVQGFGRDAAGNGTPQRGFAALSLPELAAGGGGKLILDKPLNAEQNHYPPAGTRDLMRIITFTALTANDAPENQTIYRKRIQRYTPDMKMDTSMSGKAFDYSITTLILGYL